MITSPFNVDEPAAWASAEESNGDGTSMEEILEATDCIGDVSVSRRDSHAAAENGGYLWLVTFLRDADSPCQQVLPNQERTDKEGGRTRGNRNASEQCVYLCIRLLK